MYVQRENTHGFIILLQTINACSSHGFFSYQLINE